MDIMFYHLLHAPLERALPQLLEKTLERNWKAVVQADSPERIAMIDDLLWTWRDDSFLAHGKSSEEDAALQPIVLSSDETNPNAAQVRFFLDGMDMRPVLTGGAHGYERAVLMFDGGDEQQLTSARAQWKSLKDGGFSLQYWQQRENGGWEKKA